MSFITYRATRDITIGQLRRTLRAGEEVRFDGTSTCVFGQTHIIPTMDAIIESKWLVPVDAGAALVVSAPSLPAVTAEPVVSQPPALNIQGEPIPFASPQAARASGVRPAANQKHVWDSGSPNTPSWLNNMDGRTCVICGVTERSNLIRADRKRGDGTQQFHYTDAHGNAIVALEELSCPTYLGDPGSAAAYAKDQVRKVRGRVDTVEEHLGTVDDRLNQLQADNDFFRQRILEMPRLNAEMVADALVILATRQDVTPQLAEQIRLLLPAPPLVEPELVPRVEVYVSDEQE
jgi:hypothetical protein